MRRRSHRNRATAYVYENRTENINEFYIERDSCVVVVVGEFFIAVIHPNIWHEKGYKKYYNNGIIAIMKLPYIRVLCSLYIFYYPVVIVLLIFRNDLTRYVATYV